MVDAHCREAGVRLVATEELGVHMAGRVDLTSAEDLCDCVDLIIVFGGDGTMLRAVRTLVSAKTPLLGINLGSLGYLTDVYLTELSDTLDHLLKGEFTIVERARIRGEVRRDGRKEIEYTALNDIVVNMGTLPRALYMEVRVGKVTLGKFLGDGLIVSTPTGSTAYNLSAGGPIVHPGVAGHLVTPICPHSLAMRPMIVPATSSVELKLHDVGQGATLTSDGQESCALIQGDRVLYKKADSPIRLVKMPRNDFFRAMRHKLQWGAIKRRRNQK